MCAYHLGMSKLQDYSGYANVSEISCELKIIATNIDQWMTVAKFQYWYMCKSDVAALMVCKKK